jgi:hypothetical protein
VEECDQRASLVKSVTRKERKVKAFLFLLQGNVKIAFLARANLLPRRGFTKSDSYNKEK